ncbi:LPXTG cell wall anchor domain-containing protein [Lactococcus petauri]|uniref:LPXTG cell wall anchor domain-containing protein n=1 Tax=Lactococcus petauri TaxID=1940789 RepID=UPI0025711368|nr:LPXTG cell wall anchor domain-containing protein [Lactococcus petauri]WJE12378.1 LPXTG cell wall anchor domain-containing protein [Lactococcus petauri]
MTERKAIKAKKQAIRRARLKKAGTVAAMLPLVMSKGAPVATLIRGRHDEEVPGIEQVVEMPEQEIADVVLPETPAEAMYEEAKEAEVLEELEIQEITETPATFEAPQKFEAPRFSEGGLTQFEASDAYVGIVPLAVNWGAKETWPVAQIISVQWESATRIRIHFETTADNGKTLGTGQIDRMQFRVSVGDELVDYVSYAGTENSQGTTYIVFLEGITQDLFGDVTVYAGDPFPHQGGDDSFRLAGSSVRPNHHVPIVITEEHIRLGRVADKFVGEDVLVSYSDVMDWPFLDLPQLGFTGSFDFISRISNIEFASTAIVGPSPINYGAVDWEEIRGAIEDELERQTNLPAEQYYRVDLSALQNFTNTGLFEQAKVRENVPVALQNIVVNRGRVETRPFDATRTVKHIEEHLSLVFDIEMANGEIIDDIPPLTIELPVESLLYDQAGLWASFVHLAGHGDQRAAVQEAVAQAVAETQLPDELSAALLGQLTESIIAQSMVRNQPNANGLYDGQITLADASFTPTTIGQLQSVPNKVFDNTNLIGDVQDKYVFEFAIKGDSPGGERRFATATLVIEREYLKFADSHVGTHKIIVSPYVYTTLVFSADRDDDAFNAEELTVFEAEYRKHIEGKIQILAENGGLFSDAQITPRPVTWTAGTVANKDYDGTTDVLSFEAPKLKLTDFADGDDNIITVDFGNDLAERLQFAQSLPGTWEIEGLDFDESMLKRLDRNIAGNFNYKIVDLPTFNPATIRPLVLDIDDIDRLKFVEGTVDREYDATDVFMNNLPRINVSITGVDDGNTYQFVFDTESILRFPERHVTSGLVSVVLEDSTIGLQIQGSTVQPVQLSSDLQEALRGELFLGEITPREVFWGMGKVKDKPYDRTDVAIIEDGGMPQLIAVSDGSDGIFAIDEDGPDALILDLGLATFASENVARNAQGGVIAQEVTAIGAWSIGGGDNRHNYVIVAHPDARTIGFDMPSNLFGQSAFEMPNFLHEVLLKPSFADATIRPLDVHFTGGYLRSASREYTGMPINPEISEFELPTLRTIRVDKQDVLDQDLLELRVDSVDGKFVHQNNINVSTTENPARSALTGWRISGTNPENYELKGSPDIEWTIAPRAVQHWKDIVGAQAGRAVKRFDNTTAFSTEHLTSLPRLAELPLNIDNWDLSFNNQHANPNFYGAHTLTVGNETGVREQLNVLIGPNQVLHDDFWFDTLFDAEIFPRILKWNEGVIEPRSYNGGNNITGTIVRPELVASEEGHEIIDHQVFTEYDSALLDNLVFPSAAPGTHRFDWSEIDMRHVFSDPVHEHNYVVPEIPVTFATIFPAHVSKEDILSYGFTVQSREYDGTTEISENNFVANILLDGDYEIQLPYRVEGLRFDEVHAGTNVLDFVNIVFDEKLAEFFEDYEGEIRERIIDEILRYRDAEIEPRRIEWTVGKVANKEWDDTDEVHNILIEPELTRPSRDNLVMNDRAIVARDEGIITKVLGRARFTQTEVGNDIPVNSDGNWNLSTSDADEYPLTNYIFDWIHGAPGEMVQPSFNPANIEPVAVTEVRPMPADQDEMEANVLYIQTGYIQRQYNGSAEIDLNEDVRIEPVFALRNAKDKKIALSLDNLVDLDVRFFDKDVEYDNGNVMDKPLIIRIAGFAHDNITLSDDGLREIERLLFTGRITPQELRTEDVRLGGNRTIHKIYDGETDWEVAEWPDSANPGQTIRAFPELWVEIKETDERIPIRFDENNYAIAFADRHAGPNKSVTVDGFYLDSRNVSLRTDLRDYMRNNLLTGTISPMTIHWTQGQVERRSYDGTEEAVISSRPDLPILDIDRENGGVIIQRGEACFDDRNVRFDEAGNVTAMPVHATGEWSISGENSGNYWLQAPINSVLNSLILTSQTLSTIVPRPEQTVNPLFESQIIDPIRLQFNGRKIAERVFNYDYYFMAEDKYYEYGIEAGFTNPEKWTNVETGQPMNVLGDYYLTINFVEQMSRLANGQPHVAEDELLFVDAQGNEIGRAGVQVELQDEQGNVNRNYEYVFGDNLETIGRITKAQGLPVTRPQVARIAETEIELFHSTITKHQPLLEEMPFLFEPFSFGDVGTADSSRSNLFASATAFDPGPYEIEYAVSLSDNPEDLDADDWQTSTLFTDLTPATEYFLFARQADHHNRYAGAIISGLASVVTLEQTTVTDVRPMPTDPEDMEAFVLYIQSGHIERPYDGSTDINLEDIQIEPKLVLRDAQGEDIEFSRANLEELTLRFLDKNVAYDNGNIIDKEVVTSIEDFTHERFVLTDEQLSKVEDLLFTGRITPIRLSLNDGRKIAERVFNYDYRFMPEDMSYDYDKQAGKWRNADTGQVLDLIGDYYLTLSFADQMSRLVNGQPHVAEDELVFIDAQGNTIENADVQIELRDEQGNVNRNYEYILDNEVETIGRITRAQGLPVTQPQAARVSETEIELAPSEVLTFRFDPFAFREAGAENLFVATARAFDPEPYGPYVIEYAVSRTNNPADLGAEDWQTSTLFIDLAPATEYFLFARQAEHHNRYEGAIISGLASVVTREENRLPHPTPEPDDYKEKADLPRVGDSIGASLGIAGLIALASAAILRKKNKKE